MLKAPRKKSALGRKTKIRQRKSARVISAFQPLPLWKRSFDIAIAGTLLLLLSPVLTLIAVWIKLGSPGPVLFFQQRFGARGEPFHIWKFRTMRHGTDQSRHLEHLRAASRTGEAPRKCDASDDFIPGGPFLRRCSLDELPQLVNVLRGQMSIVGPRPDVLAAHEYEKWARARFLVTPGVTGLWQVSGKNDTSWQDMLHYDVAYATQRSALLDLRILIRTIPLMFGGNSA
jgi:exopolysaccharide production protein ExoY